MATPEKLYRELMQELDNLEVLQSSCMTASVKTTVMMEKQVEINKRIAKCLGHLLFAYRRGE